MSWRASPWIYPVWNSLYFLDLIEYFFSHIREVFCCNLFKYFLSLFLFLFSSGTPIIRMLVSLILSQRSLRLSSILFILFSLFCSVVVISSILSSKSFIHSSASVILLLIHSREFFISFIVLFIVVCLLFSCSRSLLNISFIFSILFPTFWIIFTIISLNSFSGRLFPLHYMVCWAFSLLLYLLCVSLSSHFA